MLEELDITIEEFDSMRQGKKPDEAPKKDEAKFVPRAEINAKKSESVDPANPVEFQGMAMPWTKTQLPPSTFWANRNTPPNITMTVNASTLTAKAMQLRSPDDPAMQTLITSLLDAENAYHLARIFTQALLNQLRSLNAVSMVERFGTNVGESLHGLNVQVAAAEKDLFGFNYRKPAGVTAQESEADKKKREEEERKKKEDENASKFLSKKLEELEKQKEAELEEKKKAEVAKKKEASVSKMKSMLQQFKASKEGTSGTTTKQKNNRNNNCN